MTQKRYYPLCADLNGRVCVVVGGGAIAQRKVTTLRRYGARVTLVSPTATRQLKAYARVGKIRYIARRFRPADLRDAWLVYASTDDQAINELVFRTASRQRTFTNVVDQKPLCSFIAPAIISRGPLTVAVSTGGSSPTLAKGLSRDLERTIGAGYVPMLRLLASLRGVAKRTLPHYQDRKRYFDRVVRGAVFRLVRAGRHRQAKQEALSLLERSSLKNKNGSGDCNYR